MLSRHLPFDSNDDKEIGRKTIYQQIQFTHPVWESVSADAKDLVLSKFKFFNYLNLNLELLCKDKNERIAIKDVLDHQWFVQSNSAIS